MQNRNWLKLVALMPLLLIIAMWAFRKPPRRDPAANVSPTQHGPSSPTAVQAGASGEAAPAAPNLPSEKPLGSVRELMADPPGSLQLLGVVVDEKGQGVGGAEVKVSSIPPRVVTTSESGTFVFDGLLSQLYSVSAKSDTGSAEEQAIQLRNNSSPITLKLHRGVTVTIVVVDEQQRPVEGAEVLSSHVYMPRARNPLYEALCNTDREGRCTLANMSRGRMMLIARKVGMAPSDTESMLVGSADVERKLQIRQAQTVHVKVTTADGHPLENACVAQYEDTPCEAMSDQNGMARVVIPNDLAPENGQWQLIAHHPQHGRGVRRFSSSETTTIVLTSWGEVRGKVIDEGGRGVAGAVVHVAYSPMKLLSEDMWEAVQGMADMQWLSKLEYIGPLPQMAVTDAQGAFVLSQLPPDMLILSAQQNGALSDLQIAMPSFVGSNELLLTLQTKNLGTAKGKVAFGDGTPAANVDVSASPAGSGPAQLVRAARLHGAWITRTNDQGEFVFENLPITPFDIIARGGYASDDIQLKVVQLWSGSSEPLTLVLPHE